MASVTTALNVNVDAKNKKDATNILKSLGLNMSTAINMFLVQIIKHDGIPFEVVNHRPSDETLKALKEADGIISGKIKSKWHRDMNQLRKALLSDDEI